MTSEFRETFSNRHVILPVIHVESVSQAINNAQIAKEAGCDGVFLISMGAVRDEEVLDITTQLKKQVDIWVGVNFLGVPPTRIFSMVNSNIDGIWVDNAYIDERQDKQLMAEAIKEARNISGWEGLLFGGTAFKYQRPVEDLVKAAQIAKGYMDVVTTSGEGTGHAPQVDKIRVMKETIGDYPLAIASGVSPENVKSFLTIADVFLVATSLLVPRTENFNPQRVKALVDAVRNY